MQRRSLALMHCAMESAEAIIIENLLATPGGVPTFPVEGIELAESADRLPKDNQHSWTRRLTIVGVGGAARGLTGFGVAAIFSRRSAVRQSPLLG